MVLGFFPPSFFICTNSLLLAHIPGVDSVHGLVLAFGFYSSTPIFQNIELP